MGGRGSASAGGAGGAGAGAGGGAEKSLDTRERELLKEQKELTEKMVKWYKDTDPDTGQMRPDARSKWYDGHKRQMEIKTELTEIGKQQGKLRVAEENALRNKYAYGFGEATSREITSTTYERAQKRLTKSVERWFTGYAKRSGRG